MRLFLLLSVSAVLGCEGRLNVQCEENSNCDLSTGGVCALASTGNRWCSYPDASCPSGYRYSDEQVGDDIAGVCVQTMDAGPSPMADWATRYGGVGDDLGVSIAIAPNGDLVAAGSFENTIALGGAPFTSAGQEDVWVARYHADGSFVWSSHFGSIDSDVPTDIAVDANGDVYVVGTFSGPIDFGGGRRTTTGSFLVKLAGGTGSHQWDRVAPGDRTYTAHVAAVNSGMIAIGGSFVGTVDFGTGNLTTDNWDDFIAGYQVANGDAVWAKVLATTGFDGEFAGLVAADGDVIVSGSYFGTAMLGGASLPSNGNDDVFLARYHGATGAHVWSKQLGGANADHARAITTDGIRVYVAGQFLGSTSLGGQDMVSNGSYDAFVAAYNVIDGTYVWSQHFGGKSNDEIRSLTAGPSRITVAVDFLDQITIGTQTLIAHSDPANGSSDIAITRLVRESGNPALSSQFGDVGVEDLAVMYTRDDHLVGVGSFSNSLDIFGFHLPSDGQKDIALFRVDF